LANVYAIAFHVVCVLPHLLSHPRVLSRGGGFPGAPERSISAEPMQEKCRINPITNCFKTALLLQRRSRVCSRERAHKNHCGKQATQTRLQTLQLSMRCLCTAVQTFVSQRVSIALARQVARNRCAPRPSFDPRGENAKSRSRRGANPPWRGADKFRGDPFMDF
jgi:hypothetical protein